MSKGVKKVMITFLIIILAVILLFAATVIIARLINANRNKIKTENGVQESTYIEINGIRQYIQIRGEDVSNPVMIFIHGGPASPMSYVSAYYQKELESKLTIINYDQRGSGRTYFANGNERTVTPELLIEDLDGIVEYAKERFGKENVIIAGHSWGTVLGSIYAKERPENVKCYIGISQITNLYENKLNVARALLENDKVSEPADEKALTELVERMKDAEKLDEMSVDDLNKLVSLSAKYVACDGEMSGLRQMWTGITSPDMNFDDIKWFMSMTNTKKFFAENSDILDYAFFEFDIHELSSDYALPVYYIAGEGDYAVSQADAEAYFESISAPDKAFYKLPNVGHSMFMDNPKLYCETIKEILSRIDN